MKEYYIIGQDSDDGMKWYFIKDYTNEEQPVSHYDYTEDKAEAVLAALNGSYANILVVDEPLANKLLELKK